ncbi:hypothetical protein JAAARDRAFT_237052 [Jaapia argillacea MUCL 33604]|uniref:Uncharacterized protein n=1 Tax=Jaapia argillacea MUCL 33604 TaxID=933084 RepID=A0A067QCQ1_9AGAM|nr:hypothetical protein JAAARDRAFT_237052 [Jaapia argillacea MUCL 33604]
MPAEDVDMLDIPTHVDHNSPSGDDDTSDTEETDIDQNILPDRVARQLPDPLGDDIEEIFRAGDVSNILARHGLDAGRGGRCREASSSHTESSSSPSEESDRESPPLRQIGRHRQKSGPSSWNGPHRRRSSCPEEARPPASKSDALRAKPRSKPQSQRTAKSSKPSSSVSISSADAGYAITIPKADFARGRRILGTESDDLPLVTVSMRGDIHLVRRAERDRISQWSIPAGDEHRHVEDACVVGDTVVVGHNIGPCQVSVINLDSIRKARHWVSVLGLSTLTVN